MAEATEAFSFLVLFYYYSHFFFFFELHIRQDDTKRALQNPPGGLSAARAFIRWELPAVGRELPLDNLKSLHMATSTGALLRGRRECF